ncbi:MAG: TerC/Alx family metal homeostasis membrane protein [Phycisphaerales bacterium]
MSIWLWVGFGGLLLGLLAIDLGVLNRKAHVIGVREAMKQWAIWVGVALLFNVAVYFLYQNHVGGLGIAVPQVSKEVKDVGGMEAAQLFLTGYIVEASLSMDNMLVIALILAYFRVPRQFQHRVLFWGIIGAVVLRGAMIVVGAKLLEEYHWLIYVFGGILLASAVKLLLMKEGADEVGHSLAVRIARKTMRVSQDFDGSRFFTRGREAPTPSPDPGGPAAPSHGCAPAAARMIPGALYATPLFLALVVVDIADVIFAVDSIPAIFGITLDPFIVFTSNCFAILGLRAIYFAIAAMIESFRYMKASMVFVLAFIGMKMLLPLGPATINVTWKGLCWLSTTLSISAVDYAPVINPDANWHINPTPSLLIIGGILAVGLLASLVIRPGKPVPPPETGADELLELADLTVRNSWKIAIAVIGSTVVLLGVVLMIAPVLPGWPLVFFGLAILASEFVWARRLMKRVHAQKDTLIRRARSLVGMETEEAPRSATPDTDASEIPGSADKQRPPG